MNRNINRIIKFTDFANFWQNYKPFTPYGKKNKSEMFFFKDKKKLKEIFTIINEFLTYIKQKSANSDRIEYYLKKIPEINILKNENFDTTSIFLVKKFLINYKKIIKLLDVKIIKSLSLDFDLEELLEYLSLGQDNKETFNLNSLYDNRLKEIRELIFDFEQKLKNVKKEQFIKIKNKTDLDFRFNSFLVLSEKHTLSLNKELIFLEPYDSKRLIAKPIFPKEYYAIKKEMDKFLELEFKIQKEVLSNIGKQILAKKEVLLNYIQVIEKIDIYISKARIALKYKMVEPLLNDDIISIKQGVLLPLKEKSENLGTTYYPLSVDFDTRVNVINGSNMGGKTVLLKTMGFLQLLTQFGFYVPVIEFKTKIFDNIFYIGDLENDKISGLSSFGLEINSLVECLEIKNKNKALYLLDEFARTTNSMEAKALLQAVLNEFMNQCNITSFVSTHFIEIERNEKIGYYNMKGLDYQEYLKYYNKDLNYTLHDRIILINKFMRYEVNKTKGIIYSYDALKIAETLGLDKNIINNAKEYIDWR